MYKAVHRPCKDCGSSDALAVYADDSTFCFSCRKHTKKRKEHKGMSAIFQIPEDFSSLPDRGISKETARKFQVTNINDPEVNVLHVYPYTSNGRHVANKIRLHDKKDFRWQGSTDVDLFGQSVFPAGSARAITVVEGECDAMAAFELNGGFPVVSVRSASSAKKDCIKAYEYLNSFEKIYIVFDNDTPGQQAAIQVAESFPLGKVHIVTLRHHKDPNDYLRAKMHKEFIREWFSAPIFTPAGLKLGTELWEDIINPPQYETVPYPFDGLNEKTYGLRLSELIVFNAQPKVGKSTILGEITHHLLKTCDETVKIGLMRLEESNRDTALNLMSIEASKRLHLPDVWESCTPEEIRKYYDATVNTDRVVIWDHFGSNSIQAVLDKIQHMHALGCKYIILDHLSIIVSDQSGDERKQLDELATKLKKQCMELNICILAVVHQSRDGKIRGTAGIEQLANIVVRLDRDKENENPYIRNTINVVVSENRFCGETGRACYLYFDHDTGRLREVSEEEYRTMEFGEAPW